MSNYGFGPTIANTASSSSTQGHAENSYAARPARAHGGVPSSASSVPSSSSSYATGHSYMRHNRDPTSEEYQTQLLNECQRRVKDQSYYMRRAMENDDLSSVLERGAKMLEELGSGEHTHHHHHHHHHPGGAAPAPQQAANASGSSLLTPRNYYELHIKILDEMPNLEEYFRSYSSGRNGATLSSLYEIVQYCPRVVPRLYLQICVGSAIMKEEGSSCPRKLLDDLLQNVKCVQCPLRGLFLRHYLLQATRNQLPDVGTTEDESAISEAQDFVLSNFVEMNRLWVRIQHIPGERGKEARRKREKERNELRILVGTNLVRLSQLESVDVQVYKSKVLPKILDQMEKCHDALAQAYLMDCTIQVFPDEFHLETLEDLLNLCPKLKEKVNIRTILTAIMDRLANYAQTIEGGGEEIGNKIPFDAFAVFEKCVKDTSVARSSSITPKEVIRIQTCLLNFSLKCYPGRLAHAQACLAETASSLNNLSNKAQLLDDKDCVNDLENFLSIPLQSLAIKVLDLDHYSQILTYLPWDNRKSVAVALLKAVIDSNAKLNDLHRIEQLYSIITPLLKDQHATTSTYTDEDDDEGPASFAFQHEQNLVARLVHLFHHNDTDELFKMYTVARKHLLAGGKTRMQYTIAPLVFAVLPLLFRVHHAEFPPPEPPVEEPKGDDNTDQEQPLAESEPDSTEPDSETADKDTTESSEVAEPGSAEPEETPPPPPPEPTPPQKPLFEDEIEPTTPTKPETSTTFAKKITSRKIFVFLQKLIAALSPFAPILSFQLYLQIALSADKCASTTPSPTSSDFNSISYEFIAQAFTLYEDEISDSKTQCRAITAMVGTLMNCHSFVKDDYDALITKATQYAAKLLKKPDQCRMVTLCSHLFFSGNAQDSYQNPQRVLECLQRSLKIADACSMASASNIALFIEILDHYVYYFEKENPVISVKFVSGLIALIQEHLDGDGGGALTTSVGMEAQAHYTQILRYIQRKKADKVVGKRFAEIAA